MIDIIDLQRKVSNGLMTKEEAKPIFEKEFGANRDSRTVAQWIRLVKVYGIETVMKIENMTRTEINFKCMK